MKRDLSGIRQRVERLATQMRVDCQQPHHIVKTFVLWKGAPEPVWPSTDAPQTCACGHPLTYRRVIHECRWQTSDEAPNSLAAGAMKRDRLNLSNEK